MDNGASELQREIRSGIQPPGGPARRLPSLDGFRAISIAWLFVPTLPAPTPLAHIFRTGVSPPWARWA